MIEEIIIVAIVASGIGLSWFVYRYVMNKFKRDIKKALEKVVENTAKHTIKGIISFATKKVPAAQKKKRAIQKMGAKTFYYVDKRQVEDLYPQVVQELEPKRIETRESEEIKKGIAVKAIIEPEYQRGEAKEITKVFEVEQKLSTMYNKVEDYLFEKGKTTFALEDFEYDKSSIDEFKSMCDQMQSKFDFEIPFDLRIKFISDKTKEFSLQHIEELSGSSGYVAIQTEFFVIDILDNTYILSFVHPLNEYLLEEDKKVKIQITCAKKYMTTSGLSAFKKGKSVKIACLGKVVSWDSEDRILEISPIAIY